MVVVLQHHKEHLKYHLISIIVLFNLFFLRYPFIMMPKATHRLPCKTSSFVVGGFFDAQNTKHRFNMINKFYFKKNTMFTYTYIINYYCHSSSFKLGNDQQQPDALIMLRLNSFLFIWSNSFNIKRA